MKKAIAEKKLYISVSLIAIVLLILISFLIIFLYFYGGFNDFAEYLFWIKRKIYFIFSN
jgi:hypothetical protein